MLVLRLDSLFPSGSGVQSPCRVGVSVGVGLEGNPKKVLVVLVVGCLVVGDRSVESRVSPEDGTMESRFLLCPVHTPNLWDKRSVLRVSYQRGLYLADFSPDILLSPQVSGVLIY